MIVRSPRGDVRFPQEGSLRRDSPALSACDIFQLDIFLGGKVMKFNPLLFVLCLVLTMLGCTSTARHEATPIPSPSPTVLLTTTSVPVPSPTRYLIPQPTYTTIAKPTNVAKFSGIGVTRSHIETQFDKFQFQDAPSVRGQQRAVGKATNGPYVIELIGPPDNLVSARIAVFWDNNNAAQATEASLILLLFEQDVLPSWNQGVSWVTQNSGIALDSGAAKTNWQNTRVTLTGSRELRNLNLTIESNDW